MGINTCIQNVKGVTALMYACQSEKLQNAVRQLANNSSSLNMVDENGRTALFYAVNNINNLRTLITNDIDINRLDYNNDSILTYCCKNKIYEPIKTLAVAGNLNLNTFNNDDKTAAMYLVEDLRYMELKQIINKDMNFYYINKNNESALSILFKKYYEYYQNNEIDKILSTINVIKVLVDKNVNFNAAIDEQGNTPVMFLMMIEDWISLSYIMFYNKNLDLSLKNIYGESASSLCLRISQKRVDEIISSNYNLSVKALLSLFFKNDSFDNSWYDRNGNNPLMYSAYYNSKESAHYLLTEHPDMVNQTNMHHESLLIMCAKLCSDGVAKEIFMNKVNNINQKDDNGNTALHYAVQLNDYYMTNLLAYNKADPNIKNNDGVTPMELAKKDNKLLKYITSPIVSYDFSKKMKSKGLFKKKKNINPINVDLLNKYREVYTSDFETPLLYKPIADNNAITNIYNKAFNICYSLIAFNESSSYITPGGRLFNITGKSDMALFLLKRY